MLFQEFTRQIYVICYLWTVVFISCTTDLAAQQRSIKCLGNDSVWNILTPYFCAPDSLKDRKGNYRSVFDNYDSKQVQLKANWRERRMKIKKKWHSMMGVWPPLLEKQLFEIIDTIDKDTYYKHLVKFYLTPQEQTEAYLLVPKGQGKKPAVITVFYEPETAIGEGKPNRDFALQLTKRGFITLSVGTKNASERQEFSLFYPTIEHAKVQPLSMLAYAAANAYHVLANHIEVDASKIGIIGHSFGGKWAMFASCLFDKFTCAVWSDPGIVFQQDRASVNYWEPWYLGYHPKPWRKRGLITARNPAKGLYPQLISEGYNLHELHALMAPRPFLVLGGAEDPIERWVALNHTIAVNRYLGYENRVAMINRPNHEPNRESNEIAYLFFEYFLKE
ncbi:sialidase [Olivibacter sp. SDN3]|uniref:acyl-CoA thioester hydrolase/BAAT C-terminal domain-containing protein n=1 Tax=Olivibacter sp. SDN3 TaxID=2764720 RepID=UPI001650DB72|nr:acyl-CoA thioester hydrolase/BAAT C-terminal domain-containing protein [Olivibacter sp. SDN3]QNL49296.1 sialidase [Olivibacter sp. SDN3]